MCQYGKHASCTPDFFPIETLPHTSPRNIPYEELKCTPVTPDGGGGGGGGGRGAQYGVFKYKLKSMEYLKGLGGEIPSSMESR